jgi:hypothetical protein
VEFLAGGSFLPTFDFTLLKSIPTTLFFFFLLPPVFFCPLPLAGAIAQKQVSSLSLTLTPQLRPALLSSLELTGKVFWTYDLFLCSSGSIFQPKLYLSIPDERVLIFRGLFCMQQFQLPWVRCMFAGFFGDDDQMIDDGDDGVKLSVWQIEKDSVGCSALKEFGWRICMHNSLGILYEMQLLHLLVFDLDPLHVSDA